MYYFKPNQETQPRFGLRKLSTGVVSVVLATVIFGINLPAAHAAETDQVTDSTPTPTPTSATAPVYSEGIKIEKQSSINNLDQGVTVLDIPNSAKVSTATYKDNIVAAYDQMQSNYWTFTAKDDGYVISNTDNTNGRKLYLTSDWGGRGINANPITTNERAATVFSVTPSTFAATQGTGAVTLKNQANGRYIGFDFSANPENLRNLHFDRVVGNVTSTNWQHATSFYLLKPRYTPAELKQLSTTQMQALADDPLPGFEIIDTPVPGEQYLIASQIEDVYYVIPSVTDPNQAVKQAISTDPAVAAAGQEELATRSLSSLGSYNPTNWITGANAKLNLETGALTWTFNYHPQPADLATNPNQYLGWYLAGIRGLDQVSQLTITSNATGQTLTLGNGISDNTNTYNRAGLWGPLGINLYGEFAGRYVGQTYVTTEKLDLSQGVTMTAVYSPDDVKSGNTKTIFDELQNQTVADLLAANETPLVNVQLFTQIATSPTFDTTVKNGQPVGIHPTVNERIPNRQRLDNLQISYANAASPDQLAELVNAGYDDIVVGHEHLILKETRQEPVTRTIIINNPLTGTATTVQQVTNLTRYVVNDTQTGHTTTGYWTGNWDAYQVPTLDGYVANQTTVAAQVVDDQTGNQTVVINYTPVGQLVVTQAGVPNDTTTPLTNLYADAGSVKNVPVKTIPGYVAQITNATQQPDGTYAVTDPTQDVTVNYVPVGRLIPVLADGITPVPDSNPVQYLANKDTVTLPPLPVFADYTRLDDEVALPLDPTKDTYVRYQLNPTVTERTEVTLDGESTAPTTVFVKGNTPAERQTLIDQYTNQGFQVQAGPDDSLVLQRTYQIVTQAKTVTRTINFVDQATNQAILPAQTQTAHLTRHAVIDRTTGQTVGYVDDPTVIANPGILTTLPPLLNNDAWTITGDVIDNGFVSQSLPATPTNYEPATNQAGETLTAIPSQAIDDHWNDQHQATFTVYYRPQTKIVTQPSDLTEAPNHQVTVVETDDQGIQHHQVVNVTDALSADQLTKSVPVTRTIDYVYSPVASQVPGQQPNQAVNFPAGTNPTTQQQITIPLVRTASYTPTSNQLTYGPWELAPDAKPTLPAVTVPDLAGYQVVNNGFHFPNEVTFTADNLHNIEMTVAYEALPRTVSFKFVDQDANQTPVGQPTTLTGLTGETLNNLNLTVPANYQLAPGGQLPTSYTVTPTDGVIVTIPLTHQHTTVPESYAVTREITVTTPTGQVTTIPQTATINRTNDLDLVTQTSTPGTWSSANLPAYQVPTIPGYTASQASVPTLSVTETTPKQQTVAITYTPNEQIAQVQFIDDDDQGRVIQTQTLTGLTKATSSYTTDDDVAGFTKQGYQLVRDETNGQPITFDDQDGIAQIYEVHLKHQHQTTTEPRLVTRTIQVVQPNQTSEARQTVELTRTNDLDLVTGTVTPGPWSTATMDAFSAPTVTGYTPSQAVVPALTIDGTSPTAMNVTITYSPDDQALQIQFIDDVTGGVVLTKQLTGKSDATSDYTTAEDLATLTKQGYQLVSDETNGQPITFDHLTGTDQTVQVHLTHQLVDSPQTKTVTRTITIQHPDGTTNTQTQTATITQANQTDLVTQDVLPGPWTTATLASSSAPTYPGYTPSQPSVPELTITDSTPTDLAVTITYTPNPQTAFWNYIDDTTGQVILTTKLTGLSDTTDSNTTLADIKQLEAQGYLLVSDQTNGQPITFDHQDDVNQTFAIHLNHQHKITTDTKTVERTINVHQGDQVITTTQTGTITRTVDTDMVTNQVVNGNWTTDELPSYQVPALPGYTPSQAVIDPLAIMPTTPTALTVDVTYTANEQQAAFKFVDDDNKGQVITEQLLTGHTNELSALTTTSFIQQLREQGYELVSDETNGQPIQFDDQDNRAQVFTIHFKHRHQFATEDYHVQRIINIDQLGQVTPITQTGTISRVIDTDLVTQTALPGAWSSADLPSYDVPAVPGYTPSIATVPGLTITADTPATQTVNVTYLPNDQVVTVKFIDDDEDGKVVDTKELTGKSDAVSDYTTTQDLASLMDQGYEVVSDNTNGESITFDHQDNVDQSFAVHLKHRHELSDETHAVTRTINVNHLGNVTTTTQDGSITRTIDTDLVTKHTDYGDWSTAELSSYDVPTVPGYTPSVATVPILEITDQTPVTQEVNVSYTPNDQVVTVKFIDDDDAGKVIATKELTGKSDTTSDYTTAQDLAQLVGLGYEVVSDNTNGESITFDRQDNIDQSFAVHLKHRHELSTETHAVTRTINVDHLGAVTTTTQDGSITRNVDKDLVTDRVDYGKWSTDVLPSYDVPAVPGYTPSVATVPILEITDQTPVTQEVNVSYTPNDQVVTVKFIDDDDAGKVIATKELTGKSDTTSDYTTAQDLAQLVGRGYEVVSDNTNGESITFDHQDNIDQSFAVHLKHRHELSTETHAVTRTINVDHLGAVTTTTQDGSITRTIDTDLVTQTALPGAWSIAELSSYDVPAAPGYTPNIANVPALVITADTPTTQTVNVTYLPNNQLATITFIDDDEAGKVIATKELTGKSDTTSDYTTTQDLARLMTQGYKVVSDDTKGKSITFDHQDDVNQTFAIHLNHQHKITTDTKTVERTINVHQPAQVLTMIESGSITRTVDTDLVTKQVVPSDWTTNELPGYQVPALPGYTPSQAVINPLAIMPATPTALTVDVTYTANEQHAAFKFVDNDNDGQVITEQLLTGHTNELSALTTTSFIQQLREQGYELVSDETNGQPIQFDNQDDDDQVFEVHLKHRHELTTEIHAVTRTITVNRLGDVTTETQTSSIERDADTDLVTKQVDYGDWSMAELPSYDVPAVPGYTPSIANVPTLAITADTPASQTINVTYLPNDQITTVKFIDDDEDGQVIDTKELLGKSDEMSDYTTTQDLAQLINRGYELVSDDTNGQPITFDHQDEIGQTFAVHLKHRHELSNETHAVTRTINVDHLGNVTTTTQDGSITRTVDADLVTKQVNYGDWSTAELSSYDVPNVPGYTPSIAKVPVLKITADTPATQTVNVTYLPNDQLATIKFIDDDEAGKVVDTKELTGKSDELSDYTTAQDLARLMTQGYKVASDDTNGESITFDHQDNVDQVFEVHLKHRHELSNENHEVTRTINVDYLGNVTSITQTGSITRTVDTDLVTKQVDYGDWSTAELSSYDVPTVPGYTPSVLNVHEVSITVDTPANLIVNVAYLPISQDYPTPVTPPTAQPTPQPQQPIVVTPVANEGTKETTTHQSNEHPTNSMPVTEPDGKPTTNPAHHEVVAETTGIPTPPTTLPLQSTINHQISLPVTVKSENKAVVSSPLTPTPMIDNQTIKQKSATQLPQTGAGDRLTSLLGFFFVGLSMLGIRKKNDIK